MLRATLIRIDRGQWQRTATEGVDRGHRQRTCIAREGGEGRKVMGYTCRICYSFVGAGKISENIASPYSSYDAT